VPRYQFTDGVTAADDCTHECLALVADTSSSGIRAARGNPPPPDAASRSLSAINSHPAAVEALDEGILHGLARRDIVPCDAALVPARSGWSRW
jgi:hypothetical protein